MPNLTYILLADKPIVWLHGEIRTPQFTTAARIKAGVLLRRLQRGETLWLPQSRPMPIIGHACHELRVNDDDKSWRIIYRIDYDAIVLAEVFAKTTRATPLSVINNCRRRLRMYDRGAGGR